MYIYLNLFFYAIVTNIHFVLIRCISQEIMFPFNCLLGHLYIMYGSNLHHSDVDPDNLKMGDSSIKKANFRLIFGYFHVILKNFPEKKGVPTPGTPPLDLPMSLMCTIKKDEEQQ